MEPQLRLDVRRDLRGGPTLSTGFLFGLVPGEQHRPGDPGRRLVLLLVAAFASYLPARRAAEIEPQLAIRGE